MTINRTVSLFVLILLSASQNNFSMEKQKKHKALQSRLKTLEPKAKKQKTNEDESTKEELSPFNRLPFELKYHALLVGLESIIKDNSIFSPLKGVKEFLDSTSLVNNEFYCIASDFGRNNKISGNTSEPRYKAMVKTLWVPTKFVNENKNYLSNLLGCIVSPVCVDRLENLSSFFKMMSTKDLEREGLNSRVLESAKAITFECSEERVKCAAELLIAGADSNYNIMEYLPLIIFFVSQEGFHDLIPLLLLKRVDINAMDHLGKTALTYAIDFPEISRMLPEYSQKAL